MIAPFSLKTIAIWKSLKETGKKLLVIAVTEPEYL